MSSSPGMDSHGVNPETSRPLRVLELYSGIGGCSAALPPEAAVVAALDINEAALEVYRWNYPHTTLPVNLDFISASDLHSWNADLWWLSPPCQPFTVRGLRRDTEDSRTRSFLRLIDCLGQAPPTYLALENVPGFRGSQTHSLLRSALDELGYAVQEVVLCPTELGVPNRRQRLYLVAGLEPLGPMLQPPQEHRSLGAYLDPEPSSDLWIDEELTDKYGQALSVVAAQEVTAVASCFTSAYGRSPVRSGSYLRTASGLRRFSPMEILRLLGFPPDFRLPPTLSVQVAWRLVGNSLSVPAVRCVLSAIPELAGSGSSYSR
ncbi:MAG: DNA cytosine methyltransferase [Thermoanaerobaculia bacterium]